MGLCSRKDPTWGCSWRSRGRHFVPDFWCVMGVFAGRKASSLCNCLVGLSPLFKKLATFELQICTTHRVGDLLRAERSFKLAARPECTWTSRGFALKRYSSADVLTRPVPLRRIFRTIADGSLDGCWTCSRHWIERTWLLPWSVSRLIQDLCSSAHGRMIRCSSSSHPLERMRRMKNTASCTTVMRSSAGIRHYCARRLAQHCPALVRLVNFRFWQKLIGHSSPAGACGLLCGTSPLQTAGVTRATCY
ncbi:uncharacterized protein LOC119404519 isoform X1 [Rhipicephalus sanguineus]|uniref:uncharacterized protein LOC119404519 isoform X1 n=1 Tax=Rhipicephalus sanguineus TaxID=34632 RepID=UPI0020C27DE9|nr:uncharacterized protein LOC119404519 isoform X1 [Rhipicephalus sanguineus]